MFGVFTDPCRGGGQGSHWVRGGALRHPHLERRVMKFACVHFSASAWWAAMSTLTVEHRSFFTLEVMTVFWGLGGPFKTTCSTRPSVMIWLPLWGSEGPQSPPHVLHVIFHLATEALEELPTCPTICPRCAHLDLEITFMSTSHLAEEFWEIGFFWEMTSGKHLSLSAQCLPRHFNTVYGGFLEKIRTANVKVALTGVFIAADNHENPTNQLYCAHQW